MRGVNKVILIGNLGKDPEIRYTAGGQAVANFPLATTESRMSKDGKREDLTEWHRIVAWGKLAEICGQYLSKGKSVYIEGSIRTRSWEDKEGVKKWSTEIVAQNMQMLGGAGGDKSQSASGSDKNAKSADDFDISDDSFTSDDDVPF